MKLPSFQNLDLEGKAVILRVDFNLSSNSRAVRNAFRIKRTLPTIKHLLKKGAKIILISHLEKKGKAPSFKILSKLIRRYFLPRLKFIPDIAGSLSKKSIASLRRGEIILLENLRHHRGEVENSPQFAQILASLGELYINEAFSVSHREHASIIGIPKFLPSYAGFLFQEEVSRLSEAFQPPRPFLLILGGKKLSTKTRTIKKFLKKADFIFLGGLMANTFLKSKGYAVSSSGIEKKDLELVKNFISSKRIFLPNDVVVKRGKERKTVSINNVKNQDIVFDSGPETLKLLRGKIKKSKFILWNGPLGYFEGGFKDGTEVLAKILSKAKAEVIVGGGDTLAFLESQKLMSGFDFVSTGGGAMLEFLAEGTLPGIEAILKNQPHR